MAATLAQNYLKVLPGPSFTSNYRSNLHGSSSLGDLVVQDFFGPRPERSKRVHWADMGHDDGYEYSAPVGSYPTGASWVGALDMSGNVWEWVSSLYADYPFATDDGRAAGAGVDGSSFRAVKGGSWHCPAHSTRSADRTRYAPADTTGLIGFRCAHSFGESDGTADEEPAVRSTLAAADCLDAGLPGSACTGVTTNRSDRGAVCPVPERTG